MAVISKGTTFATGDQVTAGKLNNLADAATFASGAVDNVSTQLSSGAIIVKDGGVSTAKIADYAVETAKIADYAVETVKIADYAVETVKIANGNVTKAKIENVANMKVLGNTSGSATAPQEVSVLDEDNMSSDSATAIATQRSIKAYTDTRALDPAREYNNLSHNTNSGTIIENTTGRPLFVSFTLSSTDDINVLVLSISPNSDMTGHTKIAQTEIVSDGTGNSAGQVCGIVPDGWYWEVNYWGGGATLSEKVHCSFAL